MESKKDRQPRFTKRLALFTPRSTCDSNHAPRILFRALLFAYATIDPKNLQVKVFTLEWNPKTVPFSCLHQHLVLFLHVVAHMLRSNEKRVASGQLLFFLWIPFIRSLDLIFFSKMKKGKEKKKIRKMHQKSHFKAEKSTKQRFKVCERQVHLKCLIFLKDFSIKKLIICRRTRPHTKLLYIYQIKNDKNFKFKSMSSSLSFSWFQVFLFLSLVRSV